MNLNEPSTALTTRWISWSFLLALMTVSLYAWSQEGEPPAVKHARIGERVTSYNGDLTITTINKKQNYDFHDSETLDKDICSPKSVNFHPDGTRYYVNALEGGATLVYDVKTGRKLKVISHHMSSGVGNLWNAPSPYYRFTHYPDGAKSAFWGKPVESTFSHGGRYLWVPYYRRSFDINAQDPSAIAIIDTRCDSIVRMMETGPLPKMIVCSNDNRLIAVTHWGNNTIGFIDIQGETPEQWHHLPPVAVDKELTLDFSLTEHVDRDKESGLKLRGTAFMPDDRYLFVGCMGGGGIAVIDVPNHTYLGKITGINNARHLVVDHGYLYASQNVSGIVARIPLDSITAAIERRQGRAIHVQGWQSCQVGRGARTIVISPSGNYLFAACNSVSEIYAVDTRTMTVIASITVDSYPVGLDLSKDGNLLIATSQGRQGQGGNAVNLFSVTYANSEIEAEQPAPNDQEQNQELTQTEEAHKSLLSSLQPWRYHILAIIIMLLALALGWYLHR